MFFRLEDQEFEVYLNSNHILQVFSPDEEQWFVRTVNEEEYKVPIEMAERITGKTLEGKENENE